MFLQKLNKPHFKMENGFNDLFNEIMKFPESYQHHLRPSLNAPKTNIISTKEGYRIEMQTPGFTKDQITIELRKNNLTISGTNAMNHIDDEEYSLQEFSAADFSRNFIVPSGIEEEKITAKLKDGLLFVQLPKSSTQLKKESSKKINIS